MLCFLPVMPGVAWVHWGTPKPPSSHSTQATPCPLFSRAASSHGCPCPHRSSLSPPFSSSFLCPHCANFPPLWCSQHQQHLLLSAWQPAGRAAAHSSAGTLILIGSAHLPPAVARQCRIPTNGAGTCFQKPGHQGRARGGSGVDGQTDTAD